MVKAGKCLSVAFLASAELYELGPGPFTEPSETTQYYCTTSLALAILYSIKTRSLVVCSVSNFSFLLLFMHTDKPSKTGWWEGLTQTNAQEYQSSVPIPDPCIKQRTPEPHTPPSLVWCS